MYRKYRIVESIANSVSQYESYRDQVYRYTPKDYKFCIGNKFEFQDCWKLKVKFQKYLNLDLSINIFSSINIKLLYIFWTTQKCEGNIF